MTEKKLKRGVKVTESTRRARKSKRRRSSDKVPPLVWGIGAIEVVIALVALNLWQSGAFAKPPTPSRVEDPATLLPLAEAGRPLRGDHDMALIPQQTPAPLPAPSDVPVPRLDMPSFGYDFGRISANRDMAHTFAVQNTGTADLVVSNLVTSCGCTTAELSSRIVPPGRRADLTATFDPDYHETRGEVVRLVWFATNDPTQPWVEVRITADVQP